MPKSKKPSSELLHGRVAALNFSPKGHIEGVMLQTDTGLAQLNFPKHGGDGLTASMAVGKKVSVQACFSDQAKDHAVYTLSDEDAAVTGTVLRLNRALHGEVNGCHLDDGTFLHLKPEGAHQFKVKVGEVVKATGTRHAGRDAVVLEVQTLERVGKALHNGAHP